MWFEQHVLPYIGLFGVMALVAWGAWCGRADRHQAIRAKAWGDAVEALMSASLAAGNSAALDIKKGDMLSASLALKRADGYKRAAQKLSSIPVDRV